MAAAQGGGRGGQPRRRREPHAGVQARRLPRTRVNTGPARSRGTRQSRPRSSCSTRIDQGGSCRRARRSCRCRPVTQTSRKRVLVAQLRRAARRRRQVAHADDGAVSSRPATPGCRPVTKSPGAHDGVRGLRPNHRPSTSTANRGATRCWHRCSTRCRRPPVASRSCFVRGARRGALPRGVRHGLEADHIYKDASVYRGDMGELVASPLVTLVDDGTLAGEWGTLSHRRRGPSQPSSVLIEDGVLTEYMWDYCGAQGRPQQRATARARATSTCRWCA